ncbi:hypothetical protein CNL06415 [Cryptococcus deneoformans JEC21]|uniref:Uncharacterized protein n=1 Tax=Cryptococcus deneoformans (strain JEC21 / ATCC MYA-565) TaxID=214684 RepID=A0A0S2M651_CRYD1|nr:hypothetical protein CNL06415 [Cryptococcus neoformans var. neoformans JEC21]ALO69706.1 hypothetical protein CNL06415 [Cryptococcus neoformans var. neoformans JEC21]
MGKISKTHNPGSDNQADQFETNDGSRHLADSPTFVIQVVLLDFLQLRETILFGHTERPCKPPAIKIIEPLLDRSCFKGTATSRTIELPFANAFQIPRAVPNNESSPTKMGIEAIKVMALVDRANEEMRIGQRGWTVDVYHKVKRTYRKAFSIQFYQKRNRSMGSKRLK